MIVENPSLETTPHRPQIHPNLIFFLTFSLVIAAATPLVLNMSDTKNQLRLLSPLPEADAVFPTRPAANPVAIAAPASDSATEKNTALATSNSTQNTFVVPAGESEYQVYNPKVSSNSYLYLIPATKTNSVVSVKSKSAGVFTIQVSPSENLDLTVDYLLINQ